MPVFRDEEVLIKVKYCGICGTDIRAFYGKHPFISFPIVPGHECSGFIADTHGDSELNVGKRVTIFPPIGCGECKNCAEGHYNSCDALKVIGCQTGGGLAEYISLKSSNIIPLPDKLSFEEGALVEPAAVGVYAARRGCLKGGENVAILGAGPIGQFVSQCARAKGAGKIVITDIYHNRLKLAEVLGADYTINASKGNIVKTIKKRIGLSNIDVVFECVGVTATINQAIQIASKGSRIVVLGIFHRDVPVKMGLVQDKELELIGSNMYLKDDFYTAIDLITKDRIRVKPLISRIYDIAEASSAFNFAATQKNKSVKVLIRIDS